MATDKMHYDVNKLNKIAKDKDQYNGAQEFYLGLDREYPDELKSSKPPNNRKHWCSF